MKRLQLEGQRFGRLTVVKLDSIRSGNSYWLCKCDCGISKAVCGQALKQSHRGTKSCGCFMREYQTITVPKRNYKHGNATRINTSKEYNAWHGIKLRCLNINDPSYANYGGRGINVCDQWADSFTQFLRDMGPRPKGHSLERVDVNGNYEPENCKWIPMSEQARNKRNTVRILVNGKEMCLSAVATSFGVHKESLWQRYKKGDDVLAAAKQLAAGIGRDGRRIYKKPDSNDPH